MPKKNKFENAYTVNFMGCDFILGVSGKFDKDFFAVRAILEKPIWTAADRMRLLTIYQPAYHTSGKIEEIMSFDSSATNCAFCKNMRACAEKNPAHICGCCYDFSQEGYRVEVMNRHSLNMLIMSTVEFTLEELSIVPVGAINRVDSSGDIPNQVYAENMIKIASLHLNVKFAFWTKHAAALIAASDKLGKPSNCIYILSSVIIGRSSGLPKYFDYVFTVYPDKETTEKAISAGAFECNGKKCKECGFSCYFGKFPAGANIAERLRGADKAKIAAIKKWLENN